MNTVVGERDDGVARAAGDEPRCRRPRRLLDDGARRGAGAVPEDRAAAPADERPSGATRSWRSPPGDGAQKSPRRPAAAAVLVEVEAREPAGRRPAVPGAAAGSAMPRTPPRRPRGPARAPEAAPPARRGATCAAAPRPSPAPFPGGRAFGSPSRSAASGSAAAPSATAGGRPGGGPPRCHRRATGAVGAVPAAACCAEGNALAGAAATRRTACAGTASPSPCPGPGRAGASSLTFCSSGRPQSPPSAADFPSDLVQHQSHRLRIHLADRCCAVTSKTCSGSLDAVVRPPRRVRRRNPPAAQSLSGTRPRHAAAKRVSAMRQSSRAK